MQPPPVAAPSTNGGPTIRPHLSVSQLTMYLRCSMQYYFRYVLGIKERPNLAMLNGTAGHAAVEYNYKKKITTKLDEPLEKILDIFSDSYDAETAVLEPQDMKPGDDLGDTKDKTVESLRIWRLREAPMRRPLAVEASFDLIVPVDETFQLEIPPINGRIDLIDQSGTLDNKFTGRMKSQADVDLSSQLDTYDAALTQKGISLPSVGLTVFTPPGKTVPAQARTIWRSERLMLPEPRLSRRERIFYKFRTAWRGILAGDFEPIDDPRTCGWCGYYDRCQSQTAADYRALARAQKEIR